MCRHGSSARKSLGMAKDVLQGRSPEVALSPAEHVGPPQPAEDCLSQLDVDITIASRIISYMCSLNFNWMLHPVPPDLISGAQLRIVDHPIELGVKAFSKQGYGSCWVT